MDAFRDLSESEVDRVAQVLDEIDKCTDDDREKALRRLEQEPPPVANAVRALACARSTPAIPGYGPLTPVEHTGGTCLLYRALNLGLMTEVAIKTPRERTRTLRDAFHNERDALLALQDRAIARIIDAGTLEDGRPYLATQWVDGVTLDRHVASAQPDLDERFRLFNLVCRGIATAHDESMLHLDIKPGNILIEQRSNRRAEPKIIDFGAARLADASGRLSMCTPAYTSPEQWLAFKSIGGDGKHGLSEACDVFGLGALLYLLMTGVEAFPEREHLRGESLSASRSSALRSVHRRMASVVERALSLEPEKRHQDAAKLAEDVGLVIAGRFPSKYRPTPGEWARAQWRQHRTIAIAGATTALLLVTSIVGLAVATQSQARLRTISEAWFDAVVRSFASAASAHATIPSTEPVHYLLRHADTIDRDFGHDPTRARVLHDLCGRAFLDTGAIEDAIAHLTAAMTMTEQAMGAADPQTLTSKHNLAEALRQGGRYDEAATLYEEALRGRMAAGVDMLDVLRSKVGLASALVGAGMAAKAELLFSEAADGWRQVLESPRQSDPTTRAQWRAERVIAEGDRLASIQAQGPARYGDLLAAYPALLSNAEDIWGEGGERTLVIANNYFHLLVETSPPASRDRLEETRQLGVSLLDRMIERQGPGHPTALLIRHNLAVVMDRLGDPDAEDSYRQVLADRERHLGAGHPQTLETAQSLAAFLRNAGRPDDAICVINDTLAKSKGRTPDLIQITLGSTLGELLLLKGETNRALDVLLEAEREWRTMGAPQTPHGGVLLLRLADALTSDARREDAGDRLREAEPMIAMLPEHHPLRERFQNAIAAAPAYAAP